MKKYIFLVIFMVIAYLCFAILPTVFKFSLPTGGWNWLSFVGVVIGLFFALFGINEQIKANHKQMLSQQQLAVVPHLDTNAYAPFSATATNNIFRVFLEDNGKIYNDGFKIIRDVKKEKPNDFNARINVRINSIGLSAAFQITTFLYELESVEGIDSLDDIETKPIEDFYLKIKYQNYKYFETRGNDATANNHDWIIAPIYNLGTGVGEFNLVFDCSKTKMKYRSILKFEFEDIYKNKYYQLMYLYFDSKQCAALPLSTVFSISESSPKD